MAGFGNQSKLQQKPTILNMSTKSLLLATLGGAVTTFILGYLLYGMALNGFFQGNMGSATGVMIEPENMSAGHMFHIFLGNAAMALLIALIFGRWANISTFATGMKAGAVILALVAAYFNLISLGTANIMTPTSAIVDLLVSAVLGAVGGGVVAMILGKTAD